MTHDYTVAMKKGDDVRIGTGCSAEEPILNVHFAI